MRWITSVPFAAWRPVLAAAALAAGVWATACGGGDDSQATATATALITEQPTGGSPTEVGIAGLTEAERADSERMLKEIFADETVTAAEYERAVLAMVQCFDNHGLEHGTPFWYTGSSVPRWAVEVQVPPLQPGQPDPSEFCSEAYESKVQLRWNEQNEPSEVERQERERDAVQCVKRLGHDVGDFAAATSLMNNMRGQLGWASVQMCIIGSTQGGVPTPEGTPGR